MSIIVGFELVDSDIGNKDERTVFEKFIQLVRNGRLLKEHFYKR